MSSSRPAPTGPAKPSKRAQDAATATTTTLPNMSSLLVNRAFTKAVDRYNAGCVPGSELTREQLLGNVPLARQPALSPKPGASSTRAAVPGQQHQLTRRQVHGDMCAVVLSLAWPQSSTSKPAAGAAIAAAGQRSRARAKYHWHLLRQYVK